MDVNPSPYSPAYGKLWQDTASGSYVIKQIDRAVNLDDAKACVGVAESKLSAV